MSDSTVYVKVDLVALRALIRDGSVTLQGSRHREPARSVTVWLGLAEDLARDDDPPFPPAHLDPEAQLLLARLREKRDGGHRDAR